MDKHIFLTEKEIEQFPKWNADYCMDDLNVWSWDSMLNIVETGLPTCLICKGLRSTVKLVKTLSSWKSKFSNFDMNAILQKFSITNNGYLCEFCFKTICEWDYLCSKAKLVESFLKKLHHSAEGLQDYNPSITLVDAPLPEVSGLTVHVNSNDDAKNDIIEYNFITKSDNKRKPCMISKCKTTSVRAGPVDMWCEGKCKYCGTVVAIGDKISHERSHYCPHCYIFLHRPKQMSTHLRKVHDLNIDEWKPFKCSFCGKKYSSKGSLHNHRLTVHSKKKFTCDICSAVFSHPRLLKSHAVRHQSKTIQCPKCSSRFYTNIDLNKHLNQVHDKIRPYQCTICLKTFCQRSVLNHHLSQHDDREARSVLEPNISVFVEDEQNNIDIEAVISETVQNFDQINDLDSLLVLE